MASAKRLLILTTLAAGIPALALSQSPCPVGLTPPATNPTLSSDLICMLPQVYGAGGMVGSQDAATGNQLGGPLHPTEGHEAHFQASAIKSFSPVNQEIGAELSRLPIAAPVAGVVFQGGVWTTALTFGPILADRAETLGKHRLFVGASYQYFQFDSADGVDLRKFGVLLTHEPEPDEGNPFFTNDVIATLNRVDLKVHQVTFVGTYGLGNNLDLSVAVPVLNIRMAANSQATIFNFEPPPVNHYFDTVSMTKDANESYIDQYDASFRNTGTAMGPGDVTIRAKYKAWVATGEKSAVAVGVDARIPSGDPYRYLGSGTWGIQPFVTYSRSGRLSPHATAGFQSNGDSILAGDVTSATATKGKLPDVFTYSVGGDLGLGHRMSVSSDFFGQSLLHASQIRAVTTTDVRGGEHANIASSTGTVNELSVAVGAKLELVQRLLLIGNVLFRVNDAGLHSIPVPLLGISYSF